MSVDAGWDSSASGGSFASSGGAEALSCSPVAGGVCWSEVAEVVAAAVDSGFEVVDVPSLAGDDEVAADVAGDLAVFDTGVIGRNGLTIVFT